MEAKGRVRTEGPADATSSAGPFALAHRARCGND